jgi:hypothetical protein
MKLHTLVKIFGAASLAALAVGAMAQRSDRRINVESRDGRRASVSINIPASARVRLVRQLSGQPCREGRTWGYNRQGIWVDDGCRATFEIDYRNGNGNGGGWGDWNDRDDRNQRTQRVEIASSDNRRRVYRSSNIRDVRLVRQLSDKPCREGRTWGHDRNSIWVDEGCRGIFEISRNNGRW